MCLGLVQHPVCYQEVTYKNPEILGRSVNGAGGTQRARQMLHRERCHRDVLTQLDHHVPSTTCEGPALPRVYGRLNTNTLNKDEQRAYHIFCWNNCLTMSRLPIFQIF